MNGLFWNCRGAGKKGMTTCLSVFIRDHSLDFLCLQETKKSKITPSFLRKIDAYNTFEWNWVPSLGKSGGMLCGVKKSRLEVVSWSLGKFIMQVVMFDVDNKCIWLF